jgi:phage shock protein C
MNERHTANAGLYRSRKGVILGVAKGLALSANLPVWVVRVAFIFTGLITQVIPVVVLYIVLAVLLKPEPVLHFQTAEEKEFYNSYSTDRRSAIERMRSILVRLEKRVQRLENAVTDSEKDWDRRFFQS